MQAGGVRCALHARKCKHLIKRRHANKKKRMLKSKFISKCHKQIIAKMNASRDVAPLRINGKILTLNVD